MKISIIVCIAGLLVFGTVAHAEENKFSVKYAELYLEAETAFLDSKKNDEAEALAEKLLAQELNNYERVATLSLLASIRDKLEDHRGAADALNQLLEIDTSLAAAQQQQLQYKISRLYLHAYQKSRDEIDANASIEAFAVFEALGGELELEDILQIANLLRYTYRHQEAISLIEKTYSGEPDELKQRRYGDYLLYLYNIVGHFDEVRSLSQELWHRTNNERYLVGSIETFHYSGWGRESLDWCSEFAANEALSDDTIIGLLVCQRKSSLALNLPTVTYDARLCREFGKSVVCSTE